MFKRAVLGLVLLVMLVLSAGCSPDLLLSDAQYTMDVMTVQAINAADAKTTAINALTDDPNADFVSQNKRCKPGFACCSVSAH